MQFFDKYVAAVVSAIEFMEQVSIRSTVGSNLGKKCNSLERVLLTCESAKIKVTFQAFL